jgi:hypothetical protein
MSPDKYAELYGHALNMAKTMPLQTVITDAGWYECGCALGNQMIPRRGINSESILVDTGETVEEMGVDRNLSDCQLVHQLVSVGFKILSAGKVAFLICVLTLALVYEDVRDLAPKLLPRFVTILFGFTNNGKTTVARKIMTPFINRATMISAQSSPRLIQRMLQNIFSRILLIDDFPPNMPRAERVEKLEAIVRVCGDIDAQRVTCNDLKDGSKPIASMAVVTAEDYYAEGVSSVTRTIAVPIEIGECDFSAINMLDDHVIPTYAFRILRHYLENDGLKKLRTAFEAHRQELMENSDLKKFRRVIDNLAIVLATWDFCQEFLLDTCTPDLSKTITEEGEALGRFLTESAAFQKNTLDSQNEALTFLQDIKRRLSLREVSFVELHTDSDNHYTAPGEGVQDIYESKNFVYVNVNFEERVRRDLARDKKVVSGRRKLREMLENQGILIKNHPDYLSTRLTVNGIKHSFLQLNKNKVMKKFEECE